MKFDNVRVKENINDDIIAEAIEFISGACFINGGFNPFYKGIAQRIAVVKYFIDGIEFEDGDSLFVAAEIEDVKKIISRFMADPKFVNEAKIMKIVNDNADDVIEFKKQRLIHGADAIEEIASTLRDFRSFIDDLDTALGNLVKIDLSSINNEDIESARKLMSMIARDDFKLTTDNLADVIKKAANYNIDEASQEIIDAKNKQIEELTKRNKQLEMQYSARNVADYKKEVDE